MSEKTITIPETQFASLMGQAAFLRAAVYALGGTYEVSFENLSQNGKGKFELRGDPTRRSITCVLIEDSVQEPQGRPYTESFELEVRDSQDSKRPPAAKFGAKRAKAHE
jgi:hypothetical protein